MRPFGGWLLPSIQHNVSKISLCCSSNHHLIPSYGQVVFHCVSKPHSLIIHSSVSIWVVPTFWFLWIVLLLPFSYRFLYGCYVFSSLVYTYLGVELLAYISLCLTVWGTARRVPKVTVPSPIPPAVCGGSSLSTPSPALTVVSDDSCPKDVTSNILSCAFWPFWINVQILSPFFN